MKVVIIHYHLKSGGVSTVIRRQVAALRSNGIECVVMVGEQPATDPGFSVLVEPLLGYDSPTESAAVPVRASGIARAIAGQCGRPGHTAIIHVHNPTIRKNAALLPALTQLSSAGHHLVMHVHDLAEDWRPEVYCTEPYPDGAAWITINRRDAWALREAGASLVHFLPNAAFTTIPNQAASPGSSLAAGDAEGNDAIGVFDGTGSLGVKQDLILYPVRGIRRKNLGEALLLSMFIEPGLSIAVTLPPNNLRDLPYYDGWRQAAAELELPISFGVGLAASLDQLYVRSRAVLTTSIKEGFGLSYLEPLARGKVVLGRRLPAVVNDFEDEGLQFPGLYDQIIIDPALFDRKAFLERVHDMACKAGLSYNVDVESLATRVVASFSGSYDFGRLDETAQLAVIQRIHGDSAARKAILAANPFLDGWSRRIDGLIPPAIETLAAWSVGRYGQHLLNLYNHLTGIRGQVEQPGQPAQPGRVGQPGQPVQPGQVGQPGQSVQPGQVGQPGQSAQPAATAQSRPLVLSAPDKTRLLELYVRPESFHGVGI
jgi:hypothetical protein